MEGKNFFWLQGVARGGGNGFLDSFTGQVLPWNWWISTPHVRVLITGGRACKEVAANADG